MQISKLILSMDVVRSADLAMLAVHQVSKVHQVREYSEWL